MVTVNFAKIEMLIHEFEAWDLILGQNSWEGGLLSWKSIGFWDGTSVKYGLNETPGYKGSFCGPISENIGLVKVPEL